MAAEKKVKDNQWNFTLHALIEPKEICVSFRSVKMHFDRKWFDCNIISV